MVRMTGEVTAVSGRPGPASMSHELPATRTGRAAMWLALAFVIGFGINMPLVALFGRSGAPEAIQAILPYWGATIMACGVAAAVTALVAAIKFKERSWAVMVALIPGGFAVVFLLGEFLVPH